jgi:hypothetical protein
MSTTNVKYIGYHGTSMDNFKKIKTIGFTESKNGWLGGGIYFFESNKDLSVKWAGYKYPNVKVTTIECEIVAVKEVVFDISNPLGEHNIKFQQVKESFINRVKKSTFCINQKEEIFDGKVIDIICKNDKYSLVRSFTYTYQDYDRKYRTNSRIPNGVELCVKDLALLTIK